MFILRDNAEALWDKMAGSSDKLSAPASLLKVLGLWERKVGTHILLISGKHPLVSWWLLGGGCPGWAHCASVPLAAACPASLPRAAWGWNNLWNVLSTGQSPITGWKTCPRLGSYQLQTPEWPPSPPSGSPVLWSTPSLHCRAAHLPWQPRSLTWCQHSILPRGSWRHLSIHSHEVTNVIYRLLFPPKLQTWEVPCC